MRTPLFWHQPPGLLATVLRPLGTLYGAATAHRVKKRKGGYRASCPVICIGNINAGGTGKTPTAMALSERLTQQGQKVVLVSRGYGGETEGPVLVDPAHHDANAVGDEPLMLAGFCQVIVAKDRAAGVRLAESLDPDVILLDDGFQNPSVATDLDLVVVDAHRGFGNGLCIPAGPLREPVTKGLSRADLLLSIGPPKAQDRFLQKWGALIPCPHVTGNLEPLPTGMPWKDLPVWAFAGIGHPEKFFATLHQMGADVRGTTALADHQVFSDSLLQRLLSDAQGKNAQLVTTEKDAVRLPASFQSHALPVPVRLNIPDWSGINTALMGLGITCSHQ